jgi:hypothetical protein
MIAVVGLPLISLTREEVKVENTRSLEGDVGRKDDGVCVAREVFCQLICLWPNILRFTFLSSANPLRATARQSIALMELNRRTRA